MSREGRLSILRITCSDGAVSKPNDIRGHTVHELRWPGGMLFPLFAEANLAGENILEHQIEVLLLAIDTMVSLKSPVRIILMEHDPCRAAQALGMTADVIRQNYLTWAKVLSARYPGIPVEVIHEEHSACGKHRIPHKKIAVELVQAQEECAA